MILGGVVKAAPPARLPRRSRGFLPAVPVLAFLLLCFALPVLALLLRSVLEPKVGLQNYTALLATGTYANVLENTFLISFLVTAITTLIGLPLAWFVAVAPAWIGSLTFAIVILSMWTNLLARTYAWMVLLQDNGPINKFLIWIGLIKTALPLYGSMAGVIIGMVYIMLPFMIISLRGPLAALDPAMFPGGVALRRFTAAGFPPSVPALADARPGGGCADYLRRIAWLLHHALPARWRAGHDAGGANRPAGADTAQLGLGGCGRLRPAGGNVDALCRAGALSVTSSAAKQLSRATRFYPAWVVALGPRRAGMSCHGVFACAPAATGGALLRLIAMASIPAARGGPYNGIRRSSPILTG